MIVKIDLRHGIKPVASVLSESLVKGQFWGGMNVRYGSEADLSSTEMLWCLGGVRGQGEVTRLFRMVAETGASRGLGRMNQGDTLKLTGPFNTP